MKKRLIYLPALFLLPLIYWYFTTNTKKKCVSDYKLFTIFSNYINKNSNTECKTCIHADFENGHLVGLSLNNVNIKNINNYLINFKNIKYINLTGCNISSISEVRIYKLNSLSIDKCNVKITSNFKNDFPSLKYLKLHSTMIDGIFEFDNLSDSIVRLNISNNKIVGFKHIDSKNKLMFVDLSSNRIANVDSIVYNCNSIAVINLSRNPITREQIYKKYKCINNFVFYKDILD